MKITSHRVNVENDWMLCKFIFDNQPLSATSLLVLLSHEAATVGKCINTPVIQLEKWSSDADTCDIKS